MKKFLSITMCVMLAFATVFCLAACGDDTPIAVNIRFRHPTEDRYVYAGDHLYIPYTGEEYVLKDVEYIL